MRRAFSERPGCRAVFLLLASVLMFGLFSAPPVRLSQDVRKQYPQTPPKATLEENQQASEERILLELARTAVSEIRLRQDEEDRWFNYKFILVGALLGAFFAQFAFGRRARDDDEKQLAKIISSNATCTGLALATVVALIVDIHVRDSMTVVNQLGNWLAYFVEPALVQVAFRGHPGNFLPWEDFLRIPGGMHEDRVYRFAYWPHLHISTLIIYAIYLWVFQEVSLGAGLESPGLAIAAFSLVHSVLLLFAWMSHTAPGAFEFQPIPFSDAWYSGQWTGLFYIAPWMLITACSFPYVGRIYRQVRSAHRA